MGAPRQPPDRADKFPAKVHECFCDANEALFGVHVFKVEAAEAVCSALRESVETLWPFGFVRGWRALPRRSIGSRFSCEASQVFSDVSFSDVFAGVESDGAVLETGTKRLGKSRVANG